MRISNFSCKKPVFDGVNDLRNSEKINSTIFLVCWSIFCVAPKATYITSKFVYFELSLAIRKRIDMVLLLLLEYIFLIFINLQKNFSLSGIKFLHNSKF